MFPLIRHIAGHHVTQKTTYYKLVYLRPAHPCWYNDLQRAAEPSGPALVPIYSVGTRVLSRRKNGRDVKRKMSGALPPFPLYTPSWRA